jgi:cytoskeletal protein RodZ
VQANVPLSTHRPGLLIVALAALAACQPRQHEPPVVGGDIPAPRPEGADAATPHTATPTASEASATSAKPDIAADTGETAETAAPTETGGDDTAVQTARRRTEPEPKINADPERLLGEAPEGVAAMLGEPAQRRIEAAVQVWQYRLKSCVLDVILYPENGGARVAHLEARDRLGNAMATADCLRRVRRRAVSARESG